MDLIPKAGLEPVVDRLSSPILWRYRLDNAGRRE
jgi:hypothetical protein